MDKLVLYAEFVSTQKTGDGKLVHFYQVFGTKQAVELYQSRLRKPFWSKRTGIPLFCTKFLGPKSGLLNMYQRADKSWAVNLDDQEYKRHIAAAEENQHNPQRYEYHLNKADSIGVEIPQSLRDMQWSPQVVDDSAPVENNEQVDDIENL